jgi:hypothetical protein
MPNIVRTTRYRVIALCAATLLLSTRVSWGQSPNCPGANPNDGSDDSTAIQSCLDNNSAVYLEPGNPGYIIGTKLIFDSGNSVLSSVGGKARLKAGSGLNRAIVEVDGASNYTMAELILDGNRGSRNAYDCTHGVQYAGFYGMNLRATGSGFTIHHIDTIDAMCGSGLEVTGDSYEVYSVTAANNGSVSSGEWADGITLLRCDGGYVHDNDIHDNTDIDLAVGRGEGCIVRYNAIDNSSKYSFAGMSVGSDGSHYGSEYKDNTVSSGYNLMGFGLIVGSHPWNTSSTASDIGTVSYNTISGAVVNLAIDGISTGSVVNNSMSSPQGSAGYNCSTSANYTIAHYGTATLQGSWNASRHYHPGGCGTP